MKEETDDLVAKFYEDHPEFSPKKGRERKKRNVVHLLCQVEVREDEDDGTMERALQEALREKFEFCSVRRVNHGIEPSYYQFSEPLFQSDKTHEFDQAFFVPCSSKYVH